MKKTKTSYKMYPAWEFDREIRDLDEQSRKGWQLTKGGCFHSKYHFDDSVVYRYALDFNQDIGDPVRYRETFADQGWEFVNSTINGWHYFRKVYDPALPEEEYQIYTDTASRQEMAGRWRKLAYGLGIAVLLIGLSNLLLAILHPAIHSILLALACLLMCALLFVGAKRIGAPARRGKLFSAKLLIPAFALLVAAVIFAGFRYSGFTTQTEFIRLEDGEPWEICFDVKLPDFYTLDVNVDASASLSILLQNETELERKKMQEGWIYDPVGVAYTAQGQSINAHKRLFLTPGSYIFFTQYDPDTQIGASGQLQYELK